MLFAVLVLGSTVAAPAIAAPTPEPTSPLKTYGAASQQTTATWALVPVDASGDLDGRSKYAYTAKPGAVITDMMGVTNFSTQALTLKLEAIDAFNTPDGQFALLQTGEKSKDLGQWITPSQSRVTVPARTRLSIPFTLRVPKDASPGDHIAGVVATAVQGASGSKDQKVAVNFRTGSRVYLRVTGAIRATLSLTNVSASYSQTANPLGRGTVTVRYRVVNSGNVRLAARGTVTVAGVGGLNPTPEQKLQISELLPGQSADLSTEIDSVAPLGLLKASVVLHPVLARGVSAPKLADTSASVWFVAVSVTAALILFGLLAGFVLWLLVLRPGVPGIGGGSGSGDANTDPTPQAPTSDFVESDVDLGALV